MPNVSDRWRSDAKKCRQFVLVCIDKQGSWDYRLFSMSAYGSVRLRDMVKRFGSREYLALACPSRQNAIALSVE